jgi:CBS domain-containing protein
MTAGFRVRDAMTFNLVTVRSDSTVRELRALFARYDADVMAVVSRDAEGGMRRLSGLVTRADLLQFLLGAKTPKALEKRHRESVGVVARSIEPLRVDDTLASAAARLLRENTAALPVTDASQRIVGMLSLHDVLERTHAGSRVEHSL